MITEGHLVRHYQGRRGGRGPAIIDLAQDHLLEHLRRHGVFELGIALKGGTAIRKFWAGNAGRFSTDLDFAGVEDASAELMAELIDGAQVGPFGFGIEPIDGTRRMRLTMTSPFGESEVPARLDLGRRSLWLSASSMDAIPLPIHGRYDFAGGPIPVAAMEEMVAEKLARYRRTSLARDLYDLAWIAQRPFDESMVRRLLVLKIWCDVIEDGLGTSPFDPNEILRSRGDSEFQPEAIGYLTTPVDITHWIEQVRRRFVFIGEFDAVEERVARCSRGDEWEVRQLIADLSESSG